MPSINFRCVGKNSHTGANYIDSIANSQFLKFLLVKCVVKYYRYVHSAIIVIPRDSIFVLIYSRINRCDCNKRTKCRSPRCIRIRDATLREWPVITVCQLNYTTYNIIMSRLNYIRAQYIFPLCFSIDSEISDEEIHRGIRSSIR